MSPTQVSTRKLVKELTTQLHTEQDKVAALLATIAAMEEAAARTERVVRCSSF
jgi:hypothetical protein